MSRISLNHSMTLITKIKIVKIIQGRDQPDHLLALRSWWKRRWLEEETKINIVRPGKKDHVKILRVFNVMTKHDFRHFDDEDLARPTAVLQSQLCAIWLYSPSVSSSLRVSCLVYAKKEMNSQRFHKNTS